MQIVAWSLFSPCFPPSTLSPNFGTKTQPVTVGANAPVYICLVSRVGYSVKISHIIEQLWAIRSHHSLKRATVRESLSSLLPEQLWAIHSGRSWQRATVSESLSVYLKKSKVSDLLVIRTNCSKKTSDSLKKSIFRMFFCPRANRSRCSSLSHSFLKSDETKEQPWSNRSCCSLQKSNCERFAPVAHDIRSFHKQIAISLFGKQKTSDLLSKPMYERIPNSAGFWARYIFI